jgi:outer membrane protein assembly factor BamB
VQIISAGDGPVLSTPLLWNNSVYVAAGNGHLKSFPMNAGVVQGAASPSQSPESMGPQGATPVISSNGTKNTILWLIDSSGALASPNSPAILRAFDPNNLSNEIYHSTTDPSARDTAGPAVKFTVPTVANGKVYVGTQTELDVYGLLP